MTEDMTADDGAASSPPAAAHDYQQYEAMDVVSRVYVMPDAFRVKKHDDDIMCVCASGTERHPKDMLKIRQGNHFIWVHMPCQPFLAEISEATASTLKVALYRTQQTTRNEHDVKALTEQMLATSLNPNPTERQLKQVRNLTSTFHCDGACRGSTDHAAFFWCHLCCAWQHRECMLFGDEGDKGRPICNPCYIDHMIHEKEYEAWQKKRLVQAALDALDFIRNFKDHHLLTWHPHQQAKFARKFLAKMLFKNRSAYLKFVIDRRRVIRWIKARRGLPQPRYTGRTLAARPNNVVNAATTAPIAGPSWRTRKRPTFISEASTAIADGSVPIENDEDPSDAGTIRVAKPAAESQPTRTRPITSRKARRDPVPVAPLDLDSSPSDDERNKRMERAAALKARKQAAMSGSSFSQGTTVKSALKKRASMPNRAKDYGEADFGDIGIHPTQVQQNLAQAKNNRFRHARKSAPSSGPSAFAGVSQDQDEDNDEAPDSASLPPPRKTGKRQHVSFNLKHLDDEETSVKALPEGPLDEISRVADFAMPDAPLRFDSMSATMASTSLTSTALPSHLEPALSQSVPAEMVPPPGVLLLSIPAELPSPPSAVAPPPPPPPPLVQPVPVIMRPESTTIQPRAAPTQAEVTATQAPRERIDGLMQQEVRSLCSITLWDAYCDLPDPNSSIDGFDRLKMPPPADWLAEAERRLTIMFEACGSAKIAEYLRPEFQRWPRNSVNIMKAFRDFGSWARIKGPFRRTRKELGLLEEILGFADKGRYWPVDKKPNHEERSTAGVDEGQ